jgi:hypothetical protein
MQLFCAQVLRLRFRVLGAMMTSPKWAPQSELIGKLPGKNHGFFMWF